MRKILIDTNRYNLKGTNNRFLHLATVQRGLREYMCFIDKTNGKTYIEEITGGSLQFIEDDFLAEELTNFLTETGVLNIGKPALPDTDWLRTRKTL